MKKTIKFLLLFLVCCSSTLNGLFSIGNSIFIQAEDTDLNFTRLDDKELLKYMEDEVYDSLVESLNSDQYFVENVEAKYISKEYLEEIAFNSQVNIFFGYSLKEIEEAFEGKNYVFTLGENNETVVQAFEAYNSTFEEVLKDIAIGTGVIIICVTVSSVTAGSAPAVSMIFAASATGAKNLAMSGSLIGGVSAGITKGIQTGDFNQALEASIQKGAEGFKWGSISGVITGGSNKLIDLYGGTMKGLTLNEVAKIQKESKYPTDVIKNFRNLNQYNAIKNKLFVAKVNGKNALVRNIDLNYVDDATKSTNRELMQIGRAPIDPTSGLEYDLHHLGQEKDSTLAILTKEEHMQNGNNQLWHIYGGKSNVDRNAFAKQRKDFWKSLLLIMENDSYE